ncbi:type II toxin-antitoxin system Phd/YefM family antitoxin [Micromonospora sp. CPCC 206061]|uniref:type II toxin-antitoxin system Phd/YefM family antitoxin n=1 Tax=Micromonospora sp. CPCC 206061 TaxID=3122410 RepID=UPI002FF393EA
MVAGTRPNDARREVTIHEARTRLVQLVRLTALTDLVTIITDAGRPAAALVPVEAARNKAQVRAAAASAEAAAAGWVHRLEAERLRLAQQHSAELGAVTDALARAWAALDRFSPAGKDRDVDEMRAAHNRYLHR